MTLKNSLWAALACSILCVTAALCSLIATVEREVPILRAGMLEQASGLRAGVVKQAAGLRSDANEQVSAAVGLADARLGMVQAVADARVGQALKIADKQLGATNRILDDRLGVLVSAALPTLQHSAAVSAAVDQVAQDNLYCKGNGACWPAGVTAALGGAKVFLGESAQAARRFDASLPQFLALGERIGSGFDRTTSNVERITRPDRWWITAGRIGAPFAGALVGTQLKK